MSSDQPLPEGNVASGTSTSADPLQGYESSAADTGQPGSPAETAAKEPAAPEESTFGSQILTYTAATIFSRRIAEDHREAFVEEYCKQTYPWVARFGGDQALAALDPASMSPLGRLLVLAGVLVGGAILTGREFPKKEAEQDEPAS